MGVYIEGMKMPKNCMVCPFKGFDRTGGRGNICFINESITLHAVLDGMDVKFVRMGDCPLVELPQHGRLIDADALYDELEDYYKNRQGLERRGIRHCIDLVTEYAPTIIESEKKDA